MKLSKQLVQGIRMGKRKRDIPGYPGAERGGSEPNREDAVEYLNKVKLQFGNQPEMYNRFLSIMKDFESRKIDIVGVVSEVKELFADCPELLDGFNSFLPVGYLIEVDDKSEELSTGKERDARVYVKKIRNVYRDNPVVYRKFLDILHNYQEERRSMEEVYNRVVDLFKDKPSLLEEFMNFLPQHIADRKRKELREMLAKRSQQTTPPFEPAPVPRKAVRDRRRDYSASSSEVSKNKEHAFFSLLKTTIKNQSTYDEFFRLLQLFNQQILTRLETLLLAEDVLSLYPELIQSFRDLTSNYENENPAPLSPILAVDLSTCKRYGPSYRSLDNSYPQKTCSGRNEIASSVLNEKWVSVPTGSEVKMIRRNPYELNLFACEDERYQLDMLIAWCRSTINVMEPLNRIIAEGTPEEIEKTDFTSVLKVHPHLKVIERMYGSVGKDIVAELKVKAVSTIPIILKRMRAKEAELSKLKKEMEYVWMENDRKNHERRFEQEGHLFRQLDKKYLRASHFLEDITGNPYEKYHYEMKDADILADVDRILSIKAELYFKGQRNGKSGAASARNSVAPSAANSSNNSDAEEERNGMTVDKVFKKESAPSSRAESAAASAATSGANSAAGSNGEEATSLRGGVAPTLEKFRILWKSFFLNYLFQMENEQESVDDMKALLGEEGAGVDPPLNVTIDQEGTFANLRIKDKRRIFFSDKTFYVFFRLISSLYDRLYKLKNSAIFKSNPKVSPSKARSTHSGTISDAITETVLPSHDRAKPLQHFITQTGMEGLRVKSSTRDVSEGPITKKTAEGVTRSEGEDRDEPVATGVEGKSGEKSSYDRYLELLMKFMMGAVSREEYERKCGELFYDYPYFVFSMDILITKIMKQIKVMFSSDSLWKYLRLWYYEKKRSRFNYVSYYANAISTVLGENFFRFDIFPESRNGIVQVVTNTVPPSKPLTYEKKWVEYIDSYLNSSEPLYDMSNSSVFLKRNIRDTRRVYPRNESLLKNTVFRNGIECKICMKTYKMVFLSGKSDVFLRWGTGTSAREEVAENARSKRFKEWLTKKGVEPEVKMEADDQEEVKRQEEEQGEEKGHSGEEKGHSGEENVRTETGGEENT